MDLPPQSSNEAPDERRAVPRHIRDGEHELLRDAADLTSGQETPGRSPRLWIILVVIAALIAGLWYFNGTRG
jgi:hypothetical protein